MSIASNNLFAKDGFFWWMGVVEDRMDPLKLGRCRVRIIGYHSDDRSILPTEDLPWSMAMQGITSAAISGKGETPLGPLEGTWVIGFFADGKDCQQPIMMGTLGGVPQTSPACQKQNNSKGEIANVQRDINGNVVRDANGNAIPVKPVPTLPASTPSKSVSSTLPPLNQQQIQSLMDYIAEAESSSVPGGKQNYSTTNQSGFVGKYQVGAQVLQTQGYISPPNPPKKARLNSELSDPSIWVGKNGVNSLDEFKTNKNNVQETVMFDNLKQNYNMLLKNGYITTEDDKGRVAGLLSAAHLAPQGAINVAKGGDFTDGYVRASDRYKLGALAVGGNITLPVPSANMASQGNSVNSASTRDAAGPLNNPALGHPRAYSDPNSVYPTCVYTSRQDTNKLATNNDDLQGTPQKDKESDRDKNIPIANDVNGGSWDEPPSAFAAKYPYNHVKETESGHIIELDDTPNAERIHIYHKSGTFIEIDREGSVSMKVKGENYEIFNRNNRMYIKGNFDTTVDGAKSLLVKNTLDVEVYGKTTINIKNDADVNVSGDLSIKAKNINMQADLDFNFTAGNYMNYKIVGDLNYIVTGDEQHKVLGDLDMDASDINLNSGTANPFAAASTGIGDMAMSLVEGDGFDLTGLIELPMDIANPLNGISKSLSNVLGGVAAVTQGLSLAGNLANVLQGGGLGSVLNTLGVSGLDSILKTTGFPSVQTILDDAGLGGINITNALSVGGFSGLNQLIAGQGAGSLEAILQGAGVDIKSAIGNIAGGLQSEVMTALTNNGILDTVSLAKGEALLTNYIKNGASNMDFSVAQLVKSIPVDATEFESWTHFPDSAQLSKYFTLGDLSTRVMDQAYQFGIMDQGSLTKYDIISNMKSLSVNVLDAVNEQYPNLVISDAFRPVNSYIAQVQDNNPVADMLNVLATDTSEDINNHISSITPFNEGKAANLHFAGVKNEEYYNIAKWMKNNVPYDQIRLEYTTFGSGTPWISVVHNPEGNRDVLAPDKIVTCLNGKVIANYLVDLTSV